jgi:hypothetical protein
MELRERVREWLVDANVGLIGPDELIARADDAIKTLESPPDYLFAISLNESLEFQPRLDLVMEPLGTVDLQRLAARLLKRYRNAELSLEKLGAIAARVTFPRHDDDLVDVWLHFAWITDELDLVESGCKDRSDLEANIVGVLERASAGAS